MTPSLTEFVDLSSGFFRELADDLPTGAHARDFDKGLAAGLRLAADHLDRVLDTATGATPTDAREALLRAAHYGTLRDPDAYPIHGAEHALREALEVTP